MQDRIDRVDGQIANLIVRAVLDWMGHEHRSRVEPQGFRLGRSRIHELGRGHENAGNSPTFQISDVMHTA